VCRSWHEIIALNVKSPNLESTGQCCSLCGATRNFLAAGLVLETSRESKAGRPRQASTARSSCSPVRTDPSLGLAPQPAPPGRTRPQPTGPWLCLPSPHAVPKAALPLARSTVQTPTPGEGLPAPGEPPPQAPESQSHQHSRGSGHVPTAHACPHGNSQQADGVPALAHSRHGQGLPPRLPSLLRPGQELFGAETAF